MDREGHTVKVRGVKVKVCSGCLVIIKRVIRNDLYEHQDSYLEKENSASMANDKVYEMRKVNFEVEQSFDFEA